MKQSDPRQMLYANRNSGKTLSRKKFRILLEARTERQQAPWGDPGMFCVEAPVSKKTSISDAKPLKILITGDIKN